MYLCYLMTGISFLALVLTGLQGWMQFSMFNANHPTFALLTVIVYLFTETLVMFFFIGTGISVKEYVLDHGGDPIYRKRMIKLKNKMFPPTMINLCLVMTVFIIGGAVHTGKISPWFHSTLFLITIAHFIYTIVIQHWAYIENTHIILEMSGLKAGAGDQ